MTHRIYRSILLIPLALTLFTTCNSGMASAAPLDNMSDQELTEPSESNPHEQLVQTMIKHYKKAAIYTEVADRLNDILNKTYSFLNDDGSWYIKGRKQAFQREIENKRKMAADYKKNGKSYKKAAGIWFVPKQEADILEMLELVKFERNGNLDIAKNTDVPMYSEPASHLAWAYEAILKSLRYLPKPSDVVYDYNFKSN